MRRKAFAGLVLFSCVASSCAHTLKPMDVLVYQDKATTKLYEKVRPAIVKVSAKLPKKDEFMFQDPSVQKGPDEQDGTGFIIGSSGYIVTNNHVTENAESIEVELANGSPYTARLVGTDPDTDISILKIDTERSLPFLLLSHRSVRIGQIVFAIGHPLIFPYTMTKGIVGGQNRYTNTAFVHYVQTDAAINPGNSGGPLINIKGEVVGVNCEYYPLAQRIGLAIPATLVRELIPILIRDGRVRRGYLGIKTENIPDPEHHTISIVIQKVFPDSPASRAGIEPGDIIVGINGKQATESFDVFGVITRLHPGDNITFQIIRDGVIQDFKVTLAERQP